MIPSTSAPPTIPVSDLVEQYLSIQAEVDEAMARIFTLGEFECGEPWRTLTNSRREETQ